MAAPSALVLLERICCNSSNLFAKNLTHSKWNSLILARQNTTTQRVDTSYDLDDLYKKLIVEVRGHDPAVLKSYETFVSTAACDLGVDIYNICCPPRPHIERWTLLKSIHIYKKHRVQYEARTHFKVFNIQNITGSTADTFLEYIQRQLPEGIAMKVTKERIEALPPHIEIRKCEPNPPE